MPRSRTYDDWKTRSPDDERDYYEEAETDQQEEEQDMSTELQTRQDQLPTVNEADALIAAAQGEAGLRLLKHKKGKFFIRDEEVPLGKKYLAHCVGFAKEWIKFEGGQPTGRHSYRIAAGEQPLERDELGDTDEREWPPGLNGPHSDPWSMHYQLPLEDLDTGEIVIFDTQAAFGKPAVAGLCATYGRRKNRIPQCGQPIVIIGTASRKSSFGDVFAPTFTIVGWDDSVNAKEPVREIAGRVDAGDMNDEIPF